MARRSSRNRRRTQMFEIVQTVDVDGYNVFNVNPVLERPLSRSECRRPEGASDEVLRSCASVRAYVGSSQSPQKHQAIAVRDGLIVDVGDAAEVRARHTGADVIDAAFAAFE